MLFINVSTYTYFLYVYLFKFFFSILLFQYLVTIQKLDRRMVEIYILVENRSLSFGRVPNSSHAGVFHNWRILRKYCCPGSDRYRKQTKHTDEKSLWKKSKLSLHQNNTCETGCSSLSQLCIATWLGATSMLMDIILFHPDNIIEFLAYVVKLVLLWWFQCIQSAFVALKIMW